MSVNGHDQATDLGGPAPFSGTQSVRKREHLLLTIDSRACFGI